MAFGLGGRSRGTVVDVQYRPRESETSPWVVLENGSRTVSRHRKKSAAKRKAKRYAKKNKPAELNIYTMDGSLSTGNQYTD